MLDRKVNQLLNSVTSATTEIVAEELSKMKDQLDLLIEYYPSFTEIQKITIIQIGLYSKNKKIYKFVQSISSGNENFMIKNIANGVIQIIEIKQKENYIKNVVKNFDKKSDEDKIITLATLGSIGNIDLIPFLDNIISNNPDIIEQKHIAKLQIMEGIEGVVIEYENVNSKFSIRGLREAIYNSIPKAEAVNVVLKDLYSEDRETLIDTLTIILYDPNFPKECLKDNIILRLLYIIEGQYQISIKEKSLNILRKIMKSNKDLRNKLNVIYINKSYMKNKNFISRIKYMEITSLFKEILEV